MESITEMGDAELTEVMRTALMTEDVRRYRTVVPVVGYLEQVQELCETTGSWILPR